MDDIFRNSTLATELDSESGEEDVPRGVIRAPNLNSGASKRHIVMHRIFVDSRDRDRSRFPNAGDFRVNLSRPLRAVKAITLTDANIPIVATHMYVAVAVRNIKDGTLITTRESASLPPGTLAIIPLIPAVAGGTFTYYRSQTGHRAGGASIGWRIEIPQGLMQLDDLHVQLLTWGPGPATIPYPVPADAALPANPLLTSNISLILEVEHSV